MRHNPNLRSTARGRPHFWQRVYPRTLNFGLAAALMTRPFLAISRLLERESETTQQRSAFLVRRRRRDDGDVHAAWAVDAVGVDLVEHRLLVEPERVVAPAVELVRRQAAEVADTRQRDRQQPVQELPHPIAAQRDLRADRHALTQLELRDGLGRPTDLRLLAGDRGQVADRAVDQLRVAGGVADTHVDDDLHDAGDLHDVPVAELLLQSAPDLVAVALLEPRRDRLRGRHIRSPSRCDGRSARACRRRWSSYPRGPACRRSRPPSRWTRGSAPPG